MTTSTNGTLALVNAAIQGLPTCGITCLSSLPASNGMNVTTVTMAMLDSVCTHLQSDINIYANCTMTECTNQLDRSTCITVIVNQAPTGLTTATSSLAPAGPTTKSGAFGGSGVQAFAVLGLVLGALLF
ncbi:hypothetical protein HDU98_000825 [Podochytrium sp. JEL0797]|nr:hypothetical protein HDU98_000825 [Podochytrium sp. JEL0797]